MTVKGSPPDGADRSDWLTAAIDRLAECDYHGAADLAEEATTLFPADGWLWELGGLALWAMDDYQPAVAYLEEVLVLKPLHPFAAVALADGYERAGQDELARVIWDDLYTASGGGRLLAALGDVPGANWNLAFRAFRAVTDHDPGNHRGWFGLAVCLDQLGADPGRVLEPLKLAARIDTGNPVYCLNLAATLADLGRADQGAIELRAVNLGDVSCRCWLDQALGLFEQAGDRAAATAVRRRSADLTDSCDGGHEGRSRP